MADPLQLAIAFPQAKSLGLAFLGGFRLGLAQGLIDQVLGHIDPPLIQKTEPTGEGHGGDDGNYRNDHQAFNQGKSGLSGRALRNGLWNGEG